MIKRKITSFAHLYGLGWQTRAGCNPLFACILECRNDKECGPGEPMFYEGLPSWLGRSFKIITTWSFESESRVYRRYLLVPKSRNHVYVDSTDDDNESACLWWVAQELKDIFRQLERTARAVIEHQMKEAEASEE